MIRTLVVFFLTEAEVALLPRGRGGGIDHTIRDGILRTVSHFILMTTRSLHLGPMCNCVNQDLEKILLQLHSHGQQQQDTSRALFSYQGVPMQLQDSLGLVAKCRHSLTSVAQNFEATTQTTGVVILPSVQEPEVRLYRLERELSRARSRLGHVFSR